MDPRAAGGVHIATSLRTLQGSHDCCTRTQTQRSQHPHPEAHIHDRGTTVAGEIIALGPHPEAPTG